MKKIMIVAAAAVMAACSSNQQQKTLVLYYSQTGATKAVAEQLAASLGADIEAIDVEQPYDGDFQQTVQRGLEERQNNSFSALIPLKCNISDYDVIFLGYPVWFGVAAFPVYSLIQNEKFEGKTVVPFCTFGSGGLETSASDLKERLPQADIREGYGVRNARISKAPAEIEKFLIAAGFKEGEVEILPEFSEIHDVTEEDAAIFNAACGSYEMPLGVPQTVASRPVSGGVEYSFKTAEGNTILVLAPDGEKPEFTKVVR